jgi:SAM-dependent methyltransferase
MRVGPAVRRLFGPLEPRVADAYRSYFIDLDDLARTLSRLPSVSSVLEVGAGDGFFATRLCARLPSARYIGVDIADEPGRLFAGDRSRVQFHSRELDDLPATDQFDLVAFVDVLHHVPLALRVDLLGEAASRLRPGGFLAVKDWTRSYSLAHALCVASDRYITGDRGVSFFSYDGILDLLERAVPDSSICLEARIPPHRNNILIVLAMPS